MLSNKTSSRILFSLTTILVLTFSLSISSQVRLPGLISDGMILQRDSKIKIWGWASNREKVTLKFAGSIYTKTANQDGEWEIILPEQKAGGPYEMEVSASNTIIIKNILVGDVWVCSGQSNMELPMRRVSWKYPEEIANCENSNIRQFSVNQKYNFKYPEKDISNSSWKIANSQNIQNFSAVAYFFAKEIYNRYKIPIGIINASLGGSPIEAWLSEDALKQFPDYLKDAIRFRDSSLIRQIETSDKARTDNWYKLLRQKDKGYENPLQSWHSMELNTSNWQTMKVPGYWSSTSLGPVNGVVWFRKEIDVPAKLSGKQTKLILGRIVDADSVYVNGVFVGTISYQYPPRRYDIPIGLLRAGKNIVSIRVISNSGNGGFVPDKQYAMISEGDTLDITGDWQYRLGAQMEPLVGPTFIRWKPMGLYNAMIAPLLNFNIKGVLWYQGESNTDRSMEYRKALPALIRDWRLKWKLGDLPFIIVQLPNFMEPKDQPSESNWALMRESQLKALSVSNTGLVVAIDLGEWNDIHPLNKKDIGKRLALQTEKLAYHENKTIASGPIYQSMKIVRNKIILTFSNIAEGLESKDGKNLKQFAIAGPDKKFVWAEAKIEKGKVIVWNSLVKNPVAVRYAWADNPQGANLCNSEGLPASPFRTDTW